MRLLLPIVLLGTAAFAQTNAGLGVKCETVAAAGGQSLYDKVLSALGPAGSGLGLWGLATRNRSLEILGATAAGASALYTYLQGQKSVTICTPEPSLWGLRPDRGLKIIGPPNTFNVLPQLRTDFSKLLKDAPLPAAQGTQAFIPSSTLTLTAPLRGTVVDLLGRRMESVRIQVLSLDTGKAWSRVLTNWDGAFEVQETPGSYVVVAHRDNFKDATATATLTIGMAVPVALTMMTAPSFNCGKAATRVEKLICSEPELTDDETAMAAAFNHLLSTLDSAELTTVRREHGDWFRRYSASCNSRPIEEMKRCVASELRSRARQLRYTSTGRR